MREGTVKRAVALSVTGCDPSEAWDRVSMRSPAWGYLTCIWFPLVEVKAFVLHPKMLACPLTQPPSPVTLVT